MSAIEQLLEVSIRLSAERNLDRLLNLIIEQANTLLDADRSSLFLINHKEHCLQSTVAQGMSEETIKVPLDSGFVGWVASHKKLLNIDDAQLDERHFKVKENTYLVRSTLCVPLLDADNHIHGVMQTMRLEVKPFSNEDEKLIRAMASQATVAIRNALLNQQMEKANAELEEKVLLRTEELHQKNIELEKIAITDALTGAYNRRYFDQLLMHEQALSERYGKEFSLVMMDIDFFKKVNDSIGHDAGDAVLSQLAKVTKSLIRDCDFLFRYGGEEFVLLLPYSDESGARGLAERIREAIANYSFRCSGEKLDNITISLGVATWDALDKKSAERLLKRADEALYISKETGRNRVTVASIE